MVPTPEIVHASLNRTLRGLAPLYQARITSRYERLLPLLRLLLRPRDIYERNRAWPGVRPIGKEATTYLSPSESWRARDVIVAYAIQSQADSDELWDLFYAYCRYGPIGLVDAFLEDTVEFAPREILEYTRFLRVGKHPRSDPGVYVGELLDAYADTLGIPRLPAFVSRYLFASQRLLDRWFLPEHDTTSNQPKTIRRLNTAHMYPHHTWMYWAAPFPVQCFVNDYHPTPVEPWLCGFTDMSSGEIMDVQVSIGKPSTSNFGIGLRQALWHFDASWWPARGIPDRIVVPEVIVETLSEFSSALAMMHCQLYPAEKVNDTASWLPTATSSWFAQLFHVVATRPAVTVSQLRQLVVEFFHDAALTVSSKATPSVFAEASTSLPWGHEIASALLLPTVGQQQVHGGVISVFAVPYDVAALGMTDGSRVDVRFDPWDARWVYIVEAYAQVRRVAAIGFEHRTTWFELLRKPELLRLFDQLTQVTRKVASYE